MRHGDARWFVTFDGRAEGDAEGGRNGRIVMGNRQDRLESSGDGGVEHGNKIVIRARGQRRDQSAAVGEGRSDRILNGGCTEDQVVGTRSGEVTDLDRPVGGGVLIDDAPGERAVMGQRRIGAVRHGDFRRSGMGSRGSEESQRQDDPRDGLPKMRNESKYFEQNGCAP